MWEFVKKNQESKKKSTYETTLLFQKTGKIQEKKKKKHGLDQQKK